MTFFWGEKTQMSPPVCAIRLLGVLKSVEGHVDSFVADRVQQDLEAFLVVQRHGLIEIILLPEGDAGVVGTDVGLKHRRRLRIDCAVQESFDGAELHHRTFECIAQPFVLGEIGFGQRCLEVMAFGRAAILR